MRTLVLMCSVLTLAACSQGASDEESARIIDILEISAGQAAADIGAGSGDYSAVMAEAAGSAGHVYATEIDVGSLASMRDRFATSGNVTVVEAQVNATGLDPGCCDAVLMRNVFHHLTESDAVVSDIYENLRPGGRFLVVDFDPTWVLSLWTPEGHDAHGTTLDTVRGAGTSAGFRVERVFDEWDRPGLEGLLMNHHATLLVKD